MRFMDRKRRQPPAVIIISLIDVLIVMLIFLMVTTTFKQQPALKLALPESKQPKQGATDNHLIVTLAPQEPHFFVGARPVTLEKLQEIFINAAQTNPLVAVSIRSDENSPMGKFINVIDAAKAAGITAHINMYVKPEL